MSAADLFNAPYDAEFRLKGTWIMIGRNPYFVRNVFPDGHEIGKTLLTLQDLKEEEVTLRLGQLPLTAMTACPSGYYDGVWYTRGPARHRYQGITGSSFWAIYPNGSIETGGVGNCKTLLKTLPLQPRTRRPGKRPSGPVTRDVLIEGSQLLVRGRLRGEYLGDNKVRMITEVSPLTQKLLDNAKLTIVDKAKEEKPLRDLINEVNPCAEIIL